MARNLPSAISLNYYDPAREYQAGIARAAIESTAASADEKLELPAVLPATAAKALAETTIARRWTERDTVILRLPPSYLFARPGTLLRPLPTDDILRVDHITVDSMTVIVTLRPIYATIDTVPADPGRVLPSLGVAPAPTEAAVVELPDEESGSAESPVLAVAAAAPDGARTVPVQIAVTGQEVESRNISARALLGSTTTVLSAGQSTVLDLQSSVEIELVNPEGWLESCDDQALVNGANLAVVGRELVQFGNAESLAPGRFRLSRLLRGRRGSEWAMNLHEAGERFLLVDRSRLHRVHLGSRHCGSNLGVRPLGLADSFGQEVNATVSGEAMRPPSPVHLRARIMSDGTLYCTWVRRSRQGWAWLDGVDAPLGCSTERYRVTLKTSATSIELETSAPEAEFQPAEVASLNGGDVQISIEQIGDLAISRPTSLLISIN